MAAASQIPGPRSAALPRWIHPWTCRVWANSSGNSMKRCGTSCGKMRKNAEKPVPVPVDLNGYFQDIGHSCGI